jgi:acyl transferase domain-containing protein/acyl carrier protein
MHESSQELEGALRKSFTVIQQLKKQLAEADQRSPEPIAVIGMACRFPGGANTPEAFWQVLTSGADTLREIPEDRWPWQQFYSPDQRAPGTHYVRHGSFLDQVSGFDPEFFGLSGREADALDPQHRLLLEVSWEALERAGIAPQYLRHSQTGVFVGIGQNDYAQLRLFGGRPDRISPYDGTGSSFCFSSARLSYVLGLHGPSMAIDTACSSGLVALHLACQSLRNGECAQALAGGVQLVLSPEVTIYLSRIGALSPDGRSKAFSAAADGYGRGEGGGMLVLKRMRDAQRDGDTILALIPGSAVNHDGASSGLTVPNGLAQAQLVREAVRRAQLSPRDVDWVEAHGTGTILGDPIELSALAEVFPAEGRDGRPLYVSSVKANIGHLEAAAGIAGVIKVILALQHQAVPAHPNFGALNPAFDWDGNALAVPATLTPWTTATRTAGVSAFGLGGTNAHIVLTQAPATAQGQAGRAGEAGGAGLKTRFYDTVPLVLSAKSTAALAELRDRYAEFLGGADRLLAPIAYTAAARRNHFPYRAAIVAATTTEAAAKLARLRPHEGHASADNESAAPRVAFVFSGQGSQFGGMATALFGAVPAFRDALTACAELIERHAGWSPLPLMVGDGNDPRIDQTEFTQPCLFAMHYALVAMWRAWGVEPAMVVGHSIGEYAAAVTAGVMSLEDAARLVVQRGRLMQGTPVNGGMAALRMSEADALARIAGTALTVAAVNAPRAVVIAGDNAALDACLAALETAGQPFKRLTVSHAFHTPLMRPMLHEFSASVAAVKLSAPAVTFLPTGAADARTADVASAGYWTNQIVNPVRFADAASAMAAQGATAVIEIGPSASLLAAARQSAEQGIATWVPSMKAGDAAATIETLAQLYAAGVDIRWDRVFTAAHPVVPVPTYPFQRRRCWIDGGPTKATGGNHWREESGHPFLGRRSPSPLPQAIYAARLSAEQSPLLRDHRIQGEVVVPAAAFVEAALAAAAAQFNTGGLRLTDIAFLRRLVVPAGASIDLHTIVTPGEGACAISISALADAEAGRWTEHMRCIAQPLPPAAVEALKTPAETSASMTGARFYDESARRGIEYGPAFQSLLQLDSHPGGFGSAEFTLPPGPRVDYRLDPVVLDTALQALAATRPDLGERTYIPAGIARLDVTGPVSSAGRVSCHWDSSATRAGDSSAMCALSIADHEGTTRVRADGIRMREVTDTTAAAQAPIWMPVWEAVATPGQSRLAAGRWLVAGDDAALGALVAARLGAGATLVSTADLAGAAAQPIAGVCYLAVSRVADSNAAMAEALGVVQALGALPEARQPRLLVVTRGAQPVGNAAAAEGADRAPLWGLARVVRNEYPGLRCAALDLDPVSTDEEAATAVAVECAADDEDQVAWRNNARFALRLRTADGHDATAGHTPARLVCRSVGNLESLAFDPAPVHAPSAGEVLVAVRAAGLNFKDVLHALGALELTAESAFGFDAAGIVTALGAGVRSLAVGDRVMLTLTPGSIAHQVVAREDFVSRLPANVTFAEGAGVPLVFLTAWHALVTLAQLKAGERVLIHAATGGVGQAAIQVARARGAIVLATASGPKQRVLREQGVEWIFGSRTPEFSAAVLAATGGRGVDVVLNCLTGDLIRAGLDCTARGGRFVEIGKAGVWPPDQVAAHRPDVQYFPFDLADVARVEPGYIKQQLDRVAGELAAGTLQPIRTHAFPAAAVTDAFRLVSRARHVGKVAIVMPRVGAREGVSVITGGFGALGRSLCGHLHANGVRRIALIARAEPDTERQEFLAALTRDGIDARAFVADVANSEQVAAVLAQVAADFAAPITAIYHTAGELADGIIAQQTPAAFARVAGAKLAGAWNLHRHTRGLDLDRFVLFSSVAALIGTPGQSNYAAANAGLDALAAHRRAEGLPALSVNWGPWGGSGMATRLAEADRARMASAGIGLLEEGPAWQAMLALFDRGDAQAMVMPVDWSRFNARFGANYVPSLFRGVRGLATNGAGAAPGVQIVRAIADLAPEDRLPALQRYLQARVAATLGRPDAGDIPPARGFFSLGMDSLTSLELRNLLEQELRRSLPTTVVLEYGSIEALSGYLLSQVSEWAAPVAAPAISATDAAVAALDELSETELAEMLARELGQA